MFYTFKQNIGNHKILGERYVIIEAASATEANEIALLHGIYFDGISDKGTDCRICGHRWKRVQEKDATDYPIIEDFHLTELPQIYGSWCIIADGRKFINFSSFAFYINEKISDDDRTSDEESRKKALERLMA